MSEMNIIREEYSYMMGMHTDMKLMINTIISKEVSAGNDTIFYQAERCGKREYQYDTVFTITYFQDTVELTYNLQSYSNLDTIPEKIIVDGDEEYREYSYNTQWRLNNSDRLIKENWFGFHSTFPHDCIEMIITKNPGLEQFYFVEGLAGPYWYHEDILNWENYRKLLYYKTATEEWGEPLNCDSLLIGIKENLIQNQKIHLYPNPASGYINISIAENSIFEISFYKVEGQKILSIKSPDKTIDISDLKPGLYFAEIKTSEGDVMRKIVVQ